MQYALAVCMGHMANTQARAIHCMVCSRFPVLILTYWRIFVNQSWTLEEKRKCKNGFQLDHLYVIMHWTEL
jgi:hypothetical protein